MAVCHVGCVRSCLDEGVLLPGRSSEVLKVIELHFPVKQS